MEITQLLPAVVKLARYVKNLLFGNRRKLLREVDELHDKNRTLKGEVQELREQLSKKEQIGELLAQRTHRNNAYWLGEEGPYCTGCWDGNGKHIRMTTHPEGAAECPVCKNVVIYDPCESDAARRRRVR
jgi:hypothetical protein